MAESQPNKSAFPLPSLLLLLTIIYISVYFLVFKPLDLHTSSFGGSPILAAEKVEKGYTLLAPYNRLLTDKKGWKGNIYLIDLYGHPVHSWSTNHQALYSVLKKNGNLLTVMEIPKYSQLYPPGGNTGIIQELDWNSKVVWEYKNERMHHDIAPLPNGNVAVAQWEAIPEAIAAQLQGGVEGSTLPTKITWSDEIVELDRNGKVVWSWHSHEHMDPIVDTLTPLMPKYAWSFINGLKFMEKNPIDGSPAYLASMRSISTVMIIRKSDGEILWRSPKGMLNAQHDPTLLTNGNILVFDNGLDRIPAPFAMYGSRVVEINPKTNKAVWQFDGGMGVIDKVKFMSAIVGGAQRLSNGNTLITDGARGHIFEVTQKGELVWDLVSTYTTEKTGAFPNNFLFKTRRYTEEEIEWPEKLQPSLSNNQLKLHGLLKKIYPN